MIKGSSHLGEGGEGLPLTIVVPKLLVSAFEKVTTFPRGLVPLSVNAFSCSKNYNY